MKKNIALLLVLSLIITVVGCSGGSDKKTDKPVIPQKPRYYYKWSNGITSAPVVRLKQQPILNKFTAYAEEGETTYIGSEIPPFSSLDDGNRVCGTLLIFTYYNNVLVNSTCTCDPEDGEITEYDLSGTGDLFVPSFVAKRTGKFTVTATYNGETLTIPVRVYRFGNMSRDYDGDGIRDINNLNIPNGYHVIENDYLSLVTSAPTGTYVDTPLPYSTDPMDVCGRIYVIKTSGGKYAKVWPTGGCSAVDNGHIIDYNCVYYVSDGNGDFEY